MAGVKERSGRRGFKEELKHLEVLKTCETILHNALRSTKTKTCPVCLGTKKGSVRLKTKKGKENVKIIKCLECDGTGVVPTVPDEWKREMAGTLYSRSIPKDVNVREIPDDYESLPYEEVVKIARQRGIAVPAETKRYLKHRRTKK